MDAQYLEAPRMFKRILLYRYKPCDHQSYAMLSMLEVIAQKNTKDRFQYNQPVRRQMKVVRLLQNWLNFDLSNHCNGQPPPLSSHNAMAKCSLKCYNTYFSPAPARYTTLYLVHR